MTQVDIDIRSKIYPGASSPAVQDLHLELAAGEFVCLVGPSGCGKTTLLNLIAGLDSDFQGAITVESGHGRQPVIGYVFQNPRLLPWRTVRENIDLALPNPRNAEVEALLRILGLEAAQHVYPQRLSIGMSRRAAIARAFAIEPDLLLMDEPFVSLDLPSARQARGLLLEAWTARPHTVLFVTHDLREAIALADRLVFLSAPPSRIIAQTRVDIHRADRGREDLVEAFRQKLGTEFPQLSHLL